MFSSFALTLLPSTAALPDMQPMMVLIPFHIIGLQLPLELPPVGVLYAIFQLPLCSPHLLRIFFLNAFFPVEHSFLFTGYSRFVIPKASHYFNSVDVC